MIADLFFEKVGHVDSIEKARELCDELLKRVVAETRFMSDSDRATLLSRLDECRGDYEDRFDELDTMISDGNLSGDVYLTDLEVLRLANQYYEHDEHDEFVEKYKERL